MKECKKVWNLGNLKEKLMAERKGCWMERKWAHQWAGKKVKNLAGMKEQ
jgi:hypothetical protein